MPFRAYCLSLRGRRVGVRTIIAAADDSANTSWMAALLCQLLTRGMPSARGAF
jgi:hypothetical protein